jgi:tetraacyldisaccharide 4'-kinase
MLAVGVLSAASLPYRIAVCFRNSLFDRGIRGVFRADVPVVSVGNITTGGVGKTPFVETVCGWLLKAGKRPVIVSRGYRAKDGSNDEAKLLAENLPGVPHLQNADRIAAAKEVVQKNLGDVVVLDDGFQHRRLHRDLDILLLDATDPFGGGRLLPRGFLREPTSSLKRAHAVVMTRVGLVGDAARAEIRKVVGAVAPNAVWAEVDFAPTEWRRLGSAPTPLIALHGKRVVGFAGIGNPEAFLLTLRRLGLDVEEFHPFPDHHHYTEADLVFLADRAQAVDAAALVMTQKDAVKIPAADLGGTPLFSLRISTMFRAGEDELKRLVLESAAR